MGMELEAKMKVDDLNPIRKRLRAVKARCLGVFLESNRLFDNGAQSLRKRDQGLRLRTSRNIRSKKTVHTLTYKGPRLPGPLKRREEIELILKESDSAELLLGRLGFTHALVFKKRRESWRLQGCRVELDTLSVLGEFVEVEGPNRAAINKVRKTLGLEEAQLIRESYPQLLSKLDGGSVKRRKNMP
jgi:adenylate cyclase class 2